MIIGHLMKKQVMMKAVRKTVMILTGKMKKTQVGINSLAMLLYTVCIAEDIFVLNFVVFCYRLFSP